MSEMVPYEGEHIPYRDMPTPEALEFQIDGMPVVARIGQTAVALFRRRQELDYVAIQDGDQNHIVFNEDFAHWIAGLKFDEYQAEIPKNSKRESFADLYGWSPRVVIDDYPNEYEVDLWIQHKTRDLDIPGSFEVSDEN